MQVDPGKGNVGRLGGAGEQDQTFIVAYAPTEAATVAVQQHLFTQFHEHVAGCPALASTWLLADVNAHMGLGVPFAFVGVCDAQAATIIVSAWPEAWAVLANTFHAAKHT